MSGPGGAAQDAAVAIEGLRKRYGERTVLDGVDLRIERGELVALLGPNGAGKTTTVEIIEGYRRPDAGTVRVLGEEPAAGGRRLRARIGIMLQDGGVDPRLSALEAVRLYAALHVPSRDPDELLELVGLTAVARTRYRRLSGGERQRLGLAIALVGRPELLILDEPTAGMDPAAKQATRALVEALRADGTTILLTTHDLADVERLADRVAILHRGRIVAHGSPESIAGGRAPRLRFRLAESLDEGARMALETAVSVAAPGAVIRAEAGDGLGRLQVEGTTPDPALVGALATACATLGLRIVELRVGEGSLEERYLELTGDTAVEGAAGGAAA
jgi:ABC-2 type transport system ATP-binding protein